MKKILILLTALLFVNAYATSSSTGLGSNPTNSGSGSSTTGIGSGARGTDSNTGGRTSTTNNPTIKNNPSDNLRETINKNRGSTSGKTQNPSSH